MADEIKRGPGRPRKDTGDAGLEPRGFEAIAQTTQDSIEALNAADERAPDRRPATPVNVMADPIEVAPDNRQQAGDMGRALNQMVGRAAITENHDPLAGLTAARTVPAIANPAGAFEAERGGTEVKLLRGYQPEDENSRLHGQGIKRMPGEILTLPDKEARRLIRLGAATYPDED
jgi:hypothetical protein